MSAGELVPVGSEPQVSERGRLRAALVEALDSAHQTHPCPVLGDRIWSGCVHYDEAGRIAGVGSCHNGRRADAVLAVRDVELDRLRARIAELEAERHVTNEALDDVVQALRAVEAPGPDAVTRVFSPVASLREPEGEHYQHVHHSYRLGHDLPETGGDGRG